MKYTGGCHCGNVKFEVEMTIDKLLSCNCSICHKKGHLLAFASEEQFKLLQGEGSLKEYLFNKKVIHHYFCTNCGIGPFGMGQKPNGEKSRAINVRCLDNVDIEKFEIIKYNGRDLV